VQHKIAVIHPVAIAGLHEKASYLAYSNRENYSGDELGYA
jgi:hypothetical protein